MSCFLSECFESEDRDEKHCQCKTKNVLRLVSSDSHLKATILTEQDVSSLPALVDIQFTNDYPFVLTFQAVTATKVPVILAPKESKIVSILVDQSLSSSNIVEGTLCSSDFGAETIVRIMYNTGSDMLVAVRTYDVGLGKWYCWEVFDDFKTATFDKCSQRSAFFLHIKNIDSCVCQKKKKTKDTTVVDAILDFSVKKAGLVFCNGCLMELQPEETHHALC